MKEEFEILKDGTIYLDNAATTQKPRSVIEEIKKFYEEKNSNIHRGVYKLSIKATEAYEEARKKVAELINSAEEEIIFTKGTTESLNLLSYTIKSLLEEGKDEILITEMEHHSNLVPWQQLCAREGMTLKYVPMKDDFTLDYEEAEKLVNEKTGILSIVHISNSLGTVNDVERLVKLGKSKGALTIIDAAQSICRKKIDVKNLDCDFLAFSGHKMFGPTGIGVLYGKKDLLQKMVPFNFGGDMICRVSWKSSCWNELPMKFEAGTPNIAGAAGLGAAIDFINKVGVEKIDHHENELLIYTHEKLGSIPGIKIYNAGKDHSSGIFSFNIEGIHSHDVASILDRNNICVRSGHHCTMPLMEKLGVPGTTRISFSIYNDKSDVDKVYESLLKAKEIFKV